MNEQVHGFLILMVEDDPDDRILCQAAFEEVIPACSLRIYDSAEQLLAYAQTAGPAVFPCPTLILLNLFSPPYTFRSLIQAILAANPNFARLPFVIMVQSDQEESYWALDELGVVVGTLQKTITPEKVRALAHQIFGCDGPGIDCC